jgi:hypothetical protein
MTEDFVLSDDDSECDSESAPKESRLQTDEQQQVCMMYQF